MGSVPDLGTKTPQALRCGQKTEKNLYDKIAKGLAGKLDNMQEQMGNVSREMGIPGESKKEMLKIKNTVTEVKNALWVH